MVFKISPVYISDLQLTQSVKEISLWEDGIDNLNWALYRFPIEFTSVPIFPCLTATTNCEKIKFVNIIYNITILFYNIIGSQISAEAL